MVQEQTTFIPVNVITGFLGSGKTTLLQRLLAEPELGIPPSLSTSSARSTSSHHLLQAVMRR